MVRRIPFSCVSILAAAVLLAGCSAMDEERTLAMQKDWNTFVGTNWLKVGAERTGWNDILPSPQRREMQAEQKICLHKNASNRVVMQDGVNDSISYRRCPLAAYDMQGGQRLQNRPDEQGRVLTR